MNKTYVPHINEPLPGRSNYGNLGGNSNVNLRELKKTENIHREIFIRERIKILEKLKNQEENHFFKRNSFIPRVQKAQAIREHKKRLGIFNRQISNWKKSKTNPNIIPRLISENILKNELIIPQVSSHIQFLESKTGKGVNVVLGQNRNVLKMLEHNLKLLRSYKHPQWSGLV